MQHLFLPNVAPLHEGKTIYKINAHWQTEALKLKFQIFLYVRKNIKIKEPKIFLLGAYLPLKNCRAVIKS